MYEIGHDCNEDAFLYVDDDYKGEEIDFKPATLEGYFKCEKHLEKEQFAEDIM